MIRATKWIIGVSSLLTKSPWPSRYTKPTATLWEFSPWLWDFDCVNACAPFHGHIFSAAKKQPALWWYREIITMLLLPLILLLLLLLPYQGNASPVIPNFSHVQTELPPAFLDGDFRPYVARIHCDFQLVFCNSIVITTIVIVLAAIILVVMVIIVAILVLSYFP